MRILIMGGTQFVSKSLAVFLIAEGHSVFIFTRNRLPVLYEGLRAHLVGDRKLKHDLEQLREMDFDVVFDFSAYMLQDVTNLFTCLKLKELKKYIFCSSGAVYVPSEYIADENFKCGPNENWGQYGVDKFRIEEYLNEQYLTNGLPVTIVRPTYIYGPGNNLYREAYFFKRASQGKTIPIPAGDVRVQFLYIDDLMRIFHSLMSADQANGQIFNVTHPEEITWRSLLETVGKTLNCEIKIKEVVCTENLAARDFFPFRNCTYLLSVEKLKKYNLPIPQIDLKKGLDLSYAYYLKSAFEAVDPKMGRIEEVLNQ